MKTKILIFLFLCLVSLSVMGQTDNTQGTIRREKCSICGKVVSQCRYKGKHPKPQPEKTCSTCGKFLSKCQYKGKHPQPEERCTECNKPIKQCSYNGKHPEPEAAGYDVTFTCNVPSVTLYIDDSSYTNASGTRFLRTGNHSIKAVADGYQDYAINITVNRNNTSCAITMEKNPEAAKPVVTTSGTLNGHEWIDLGLSVKWATCNVGASSPSDYGGYYAWGETSTKSTYEWSNCFDCVDSAGNIWGTYKLGGQIKIYSTSGHDTARENWGSTWRMPTEAENEELCNKCKWTYTTKNGYNGYVVTGPNGNSIFLPAAGYRYDSESSDVGSYGFYWSSTLSSSGSSYARYLYFNSNSYGTYDNGRRFGRSVRPVTE